MTMTKEDFINLVKSMPDYVEFDMKIHNAEEGSKIVQYAHFESTYRLGCIDFISLKK